MIFIPCKDGISHNEIESAEPEHIDGRLQRAAACDAGAGGGGGIVAFSGLVAFI
jgi:hypothetical protein